MRRAIHIGLFIGTLIGMCACAAAPVDHAAGQSVHGTVGTGPQG